MVSSTIQTRRQELGGFWAKHQATALVVSVTVLGLALRLFNSNANSFNLEEVWSIWMAQLGPIGIVRTILVDGGDATPPTFYLLLHPLLLLGHDPTIVRLVSIVAGGLTVALTFQLAAMLFDLRVATLGAFFVAIAPLHVLYSQEARSYALVGFWAVFSLYMFVRVLQTPKRSTWIWLVLVTAAALYAHYLAVLMVLSQNLMIGALWLRRQVSWPMVRAWIVSQAALGLLVVPILMPVIYALTHVNPGRGQTWLDRPGLTDVIKTTILFSTGDPSYGPIGFTPWRAFSLAIIVVLGGIGGWTLYHHYRTGGRETRNVLLLGWAFFGTWFLALAISQVRPIYHEKYYLFLIPFLLVLFAWVFTRLPQRLLASVLLFVFVGLMAKGLVVFYSEPIGEQWREAIGFLRARYQMGDVVVISPGFYARPYMYYFYGEFPPDTRLLARSPNLEVDNGVYRPVEVEQAGDDSRIESSSLKTADRVWLISGFTAPNQLMTSWLEQRFESIAQGQYLGARVELFERTDSGQRAQVEED